MMERKNIYFASDMHLGTDVFEEPIVSEKRFVRWLDSIKDDAKALYLLGDIFDFWVDYKHVAPRGFTRFLGKIAEMSDAGVDIHFFIGNHDIWMYDYLPKELGITIHRKPLLTEIDGKTFYLAHGDGMGDRSLSFTIIRWLFRNRFCQFLFGAIHPRWSIAFGYAWARQSRTKEKQNPIPYHGEAKEHLVVYAKEYIKNHPETDYLIFGHRHILLDLMLTQKSRMMIVGDWIQYDSYAVFNGEDLELISTRPILPI